MRVWDYIVECEHKFLINGIASCTGMFVYKLVLINIMLMEAGVKIQSYPATMGLPTGGFLRIFQII